MILTTKQLYPSAFAVVMLLWLVYAASSGVVTRMLNHWDVLPKTETVTELYFTDHSDLPVHFTPGAIQTVAFTVAITAVDVELYDYEIIADSKSGQTVVKKGSLSVAGKKSVKVNVRLPAANERTKVRIVVSKNEASSKGAKDVKTIYYWVKPL